MIHLCTDTKCPLTPHCTRYRAEPNYARGIYYDRSPRAGEECHSFAPKGVEKVGDVEVVE